MTCTPGLMPESGDRYIQYHRVYEADLFADETITAEEELVAILVDEQRKSWLNLAEIVDMTYNSEKVWTTIQQLSNDLKKERTVSLKIRLQINSLKMGGQQISNPRFEPREKTARRFITLGYILQWLN